MCPIRAQIPREKWRFPVALGLAGSLNSGENVPKLGTVEKIGNAATAVPQSGGDPVIDFVCAMVCRV